MNVSQTVTNSIRSVSACCGAAILALGGMGASALAAPLPSVISTPAGAGLQSAGNVVSAVGQGHAGIAPTVFGTAPTLEPLTDSVTNALQGVGGGLKGSGLSAQSGGLVVTPVAGARTVLQSVRNGSLAQVRAGSLALGKGTATPIVGVGVLSSAPPQGSLATAGVANANALLNANIAPQ